MPFSNFTNILINHSTKSYRSRKFPKSITQNSQFPYFSWKIVKFGTILAECFAYFHEKPWITQNALQYLTCISLHTQQFLGQYLILFQRYGVNKLSNKCCAQSAIWNLEPSKNNSVFYFEVLSIMLYFQVIPISSSSVITAQRVIMAEYFLITLHKFPISLIFAKIVGVIL